MFLQGPRTQQVDISCAALPRVLPSSRGLQGVLRELPRAVRSPGLCPDGGQELLSRGEKVSPQIKDLGGRRRRRRHRLEDWGNILQASQAVTPSLLSVLRRVMAPTH